MSRKFNAVLIFVVMADAVYIMINGLGLNASLDFGAGAYYYADMPGFEKWFGRTFYTSQIPEWIYFLLFLIWGAAVYRLWLFLDRKVSENV